MKSNNKTMLIVVIILVAFCCLGSLVVAGGAGIYYYTVSKAVTTINNPIPPGVDGGSPLPTDAPGAPSGEASTAFPDAATAPEAPTRAPESTSAPQSGASGSGLGTSRQGMITFLNADGAFNFDKPTVNKDGDEEVMGHHKTLCLGGGCASVILLGPADNLLVVSAAAATDPADKTQTSRAVALLVTIVSHFTAADTSFSSRILPDVLSAQASQKALTKHVTVNGFRCTESYDPDTQIAVVAVSK